MSGYSFRRIASDVLPGFAVGLLGYYALTSVTASLLQHSLREEVAGLGGISFEEPEVIEDSPVFDWTDHERLDIAYWEGLAPGDVFGRIVIPRMGLDVVVVSGVGVDELKRGPGWIDYTDLPGPVGNCGISGHRTTYGRPFRHLDDLAEGDIIDLYSPYRRYRYRVERSFSVTPDRVDVVATTRTPTLTLTACDPPFSARYRLIVQSRLVEVSRLEALPGK